VQSKRLPRCNVCHSRLNWDGLVQDEAQQDLDGLLLDLDRELRRALVLYLSLFRPRTRDLDSDRAYRLAKDVIALHSDQAILKAALNETTDALRAKQSIDPAWKPLGTSGSKSAWHNYLKRVIESVAARGVSAPTPVATLSVTPAASAPKSKTAQTIDMLNALPTPDGIPEWFTRTICGALAECMTMGLESVPPADTMSAVAERWVNDLWPRRQWQEKSRFMGRRILHRAIIDVAGHHKRWPQHAAVIKLIPTV